MKKYLPAYLMAAVTVMACFACSHPYENDDRQNEPQQNNAVTLGRLKKISRETGAARSDDGVPSPNNTVRYDVCGCDLGIIWEIAPEKYGIVYGDTNGAGFQAFCGSGGGNGGNWRSNVLAFSTDTDLSDGLAIDSFAVDSRGKAREICPGGKTHPEVYNTSIPTSAIHAGGLEVIHYMNIYDWSGAGGGRWITNFSSICTSSDGGVTWQDQRDRVRFATNSHFGEVAFAKKDGYVYMLGTYPGRCSGAYLGRFREDDVLEQSRYQYWNGSDWVSEESAAIQVISGPVGEASLIWHEPSQRWIYIYTYEGQYDSGAAISEKNALLYNSTEDITSWSDKRRLLASHNDFPILYGCFIHPLSADSNTLWLNVSQWMPYNVFLMSVDVE